MTITAVVSGNSNQIGQTSTNPGANLRATIHGFANSTSQITNGADLTSLTVGGGNRNTQVGANGRVGDFANSTIFGFGNDVNQQLLTAPRPPIIDPAIANVRGNFNNVDQIVRGGGLAVADINGSFNIASQDVTQRTGLIGINGNGNIASQNLRLDDASAFINGFSNFVSQIG